jgi:hypothetical protein
MTTLTACPGCAIPLPADLALAALSRFDSRTRVCSACGTKEGIAQYEARKMGEDVRDVLIAPGRLSSEGPLL